MKIIKVESCKLCPFMNISHRFLRNMWSLRCWGVYVKNQFGLELKSFKEFNEENLNFEIPIWCPLEDIKG